MINSLMLFGALAAAVPIIIHLLHRRKHQVVRWGAMHFLESVIRKNNRRIRIEQLILLIIRALIPALLALVMARPVLTGLKALLGDARQSKIVLLDDSLSMGAGTAAQTRFEEARDVSSAILNGLPRGSDVALMLMTDREPEPGKPTHGLSGLEGRIAEMAPGAGTAYVAESLEAAVASVSAMGQAARDIVVISDFQKRDWDESGASSRMRALEQMAALDVPVNLTFVRVGGAGDANLAVTELKPSRPVVGVEQPLTIRATIQNFGEEQAGRVRVYFRVDGKEEAVTEVSVAAGASEQALFTHRFKTGGSHFMEVTADADRLALDNSRTYSIPVWEKIPVLLIDGDPGTEPLSGEIDFLEIALQPFSEGRTELADLVEVRKAHPREINEERLAGIRAVILANVEKLDSRQREVLADYVFNGGSLMVFPGDKIDAGWYEQELTHEDKPLLPCVFKALSGSLGEETEPIRPVSEFYEHPALELFNDPRNGNPSDVVVNLWYKLALPERLTPTEAERITTVARFDNGDPFLVEKRFGEGRVMQSAIPCDADWSNWPLRAVFLQMTQQITTYLASTVYPPRNLTVGEPLVAFLDSKLAGKKGTLTTPDGRQHEVPLVDKGNRATATFTGTRAPGLYFFEPPEGDAIYFAVNPTPGESDGTPLEEELLEALAKAANADLVHGAAEYKKIDRDRRYGREIWKLLLLGLLGLVFGEVILQQWFSKRG